MWIRSQDRLRLQYVNRFEIEHFENKEIATITGNGWFLGEYSTEEKALKVLDEIQMVINNKQLCVIDKAPRGSYVLNKGAQVYQMPQDEDVEV